MAGVCGERPRTAPNVLSAGALVYRTPAGSRVALLLSCRAASLGEEGSLPIRRVLLTVSVGLLATLPVGAQPWSGAAGLEVRVTGDSGPIAGARVTLSFRDRVLPEEPPPVATGVDGRAVVLGLAAGTWQVEIAHPDYMTYVAVVLLGAEGKPEVTASFLEATETSIVALKARFARPRGPASPFLAAAPRRPEPPPAAIAAPATPTTSPPAEPTAEPEPSTTPESVAGSPAAPAPPSQLPATTEAPPAAVVPAPAVPPRPAPAPAQPELPPSSDAPETAEPPQKPEGAPVNQPPSAGSPPGPPPPLPSPPAVAAPEPSRPVQPQPTVPPPPPTPPPAEPSVEVPTAASPPPVAAPPDPAPVVPAAPAAPPRSYAARTCFECKPGEWAVTAAAAAAPAAGGCASDRLDALAPAMGRLADADEIELASWAGGLGEIGAVAPSLAAEIDAALGTAPGSSHCAAAGVVLPAGARFSGFQYEVTGATGLAPCLPDRDCDGGAGRWLGPPRIERGPNAIVLYALFQNLGAAPATGYLTVYFAPPTAGWRPGEP